MDLNRPIGRRSLLKVAGAGMAAYLLGGCAPSSPSSGSQPGPAGGSSAGASPAAAGAATKPAASPTIRMASATGQGLFEAPNPFGIRTGTGIRQMGYLFDTLVWRDSTPDPIPWLAEKWTASSDGTEWTFDLRLGVKFHDGQPLTAEDVAFSYQYLVAQPTSYYSSQASMVKGAEAEGQNTVKVLLKEPYAPFLMQVAGSLPILPKHIWSAVTDPQKFTDTKAYMGSGPYRLSAMNETENSFLFIANDSFFLGRPYVGRVEFVPAGDELVALKADKIDAASPLPTFGLTNDMLAPFKSDPKFGILEAPGEGTTALYFNHSKGEPFSRIEFRRAMAHAIDRQDLVGRVLGGNAELGSAGMLPAANPFATKEVEQYPYDLARARTLLDQAGFTLQEGQRRRPDGSPLGFNLLFASTLARVAEFVKAQLAEVDIKVELKSADPGTASQLQGAGNYEAALVTYGGLGFDPDTYFRRAFASPDQAKHWQKTWGYSNPDLNRLAKQQMGTLEQDKRADLLKQMQGVLSRDVPIIHLYYPTRYVLYTPAVFDAWYFTPLWTPLPGNKHCFITGQKTGLVIRQS